MDKLKDNGIPNPAFNSDEEFTIAENEQLDDKGQADEQKAVENEVEDSSTPAKGTYTFAELAIGERRKHYIQIFHRIKKGELIIPSLKAGIFGLSWLIYRKSALLSIVIYTLLIILSYKITGLFAPTTEFTKIVLIMGIPHIFFFFLGNFIYWYSVRKRVVNFRKKYGDVSAMMYLSEKGGTLKGFSLIASVLMLQGTVFLFVYSDIYMESFFNNLWIDFLELAMLNG